MKTANIVIVTHRTNDKEVRLFGTKEQSKADWINQMPGWTKMQGFNPGWEVALKQLGYDSFEDINTSSISFRKGQTPYNDNLDYRLQFNDLRSIFKSYYEAQGYVVGNR